MTHILSTRGGDWGCSKSLARFLGTSSMSPLEYALQKLSQLSVGVTKAILDPVSCAPSTNVELQATFSLRARDEMFLYIPKKIRQMAYDELRSQDDAAERGSGLLRLIFITILLLFLFTSWHIYWLLINVCVAWCIKSINHSNWKIK